MTSAPENLLAVRQLLLTYLNVDKGTVRTADLEPAEVGIVGNAAHRGGYHCGSDRVVPNDYSVVESSRDKAGLSAYASALDAGMFNVTTPKGSYDLPHFSRWCVAQCAADAPDTRDIREIIYSPDGRTVKRWDRLGRRTSGDSSHLFHTHFSFFRDATKAGRDLTPLFRRYLAHIGLIEAPSVLEDDMPLTETDANTVWSAKAAEYVDERGDGKRDTRTVKDILFATHAAAVAAANPARLAKGVADELRADLANLPAGATVTVEQVEGAAERAIRKVLGSVAQVG